MASTCASEHTVVIDFLPAEDVSTAFSDTKTIVLSLAQTVNSV